MKVLRNYVYNLIYQIFLYIVPLITIPYLSRVIGAEGLGIYSYTNSIANYFLLFAMLGLNNYGNRTIARVRNDKNKLSQTFWSIYASQLVVSILIVLLYGVYLLFSESDYVIISFAQSLLVISSVFDINWFFFGMEKFDITVRRNIIIKLFTLVLIFLLVKNEKDLVVYTLIISGGILLSQIVLWPFLKKEIIWVKPTFEEIRVHIIPNLILFIPVISVSLYKIMSKILLGNLSNMVQLGYYENADKINSVQISISTALGTVMLPRMSNIISSNNRKKFFKTIRISMQFVMFLSIALCFGIIAIAANFVPLFMGIEFKPAVSIVMILAPTGIIVAWANVIRTQYLIPLGKDNVYIISVILGAVLNLLLNFLLVPNYGAIGAAISTLFTEGIVMYYQTIKTSSQINIKLFFKDSYIFMFSGIIMLLSIQFIKSYMTNDTVSLLLQIILGAIVYLVVTAITFYLFRKDQLEEYISIIFKKNKL